MTVRSFQMLVTKCRITVDSHDPTLTPFAQNMVDKLMKYDVILCIKMAKIVKLLDLHFGSDILADEDILLHIFCCHGTVRKPKQCIVTQFGSRCCRRCQLYAESPSTWLTSRPTRWRVHSIFTCDRHCGQAKGPIWMVVCERKALPQHRSSFPRCTRDSSVFGVQRAVFFNCWISPRCEPDEDFRRLHSIAHA